MIRSILCVTLLLLSGCATRMYEWNNYDMRLYQYYKDPASAEAFRIEMEAHLKDLEARNQRPAPGLYAELGTLYLQSGDKISAASYYGKERDAWPESRYLMDTLLTTLEKTSRKGEPK